MIPLFIIIPLGTAFIISLLGRFIKWLGDVLANIANLVLVVLSFFTLYTLHFTQSSVITYKVGGWVPPIGILMVVDHLSVLMLLTVNIIALVCTMFSIPYMEKYTDKWKYYTLFMLMLAGMNGVIITGDIFNMYVFLEIAAIASYALVAFGTEAEELEASFKYLTLGSVASGFILLSIVLLYGYLSTLNLADISLTLKNLGQQQNNIVKFVIILFIVGFGLKSALVPFHSWLPDAHPSAPAPISAMLSGVLIKTLGVYVLTRIVYNVFGVNMNILNILIWLGIISIVIGGILAMYQWDYKRLLAYSSISQVGYIVLGIGLGTPLGILGGLFHLMNHSVFKSLLFLTSGAVEYAIGTRDLHKMGNLDKKMPVTTFSVFIGSMSIAGVPPFNGFWSKLIIIIACVQSKNLFAGFVAVVMSVITLAYFTKVLKYGFCSKEIDVRNQNSEESFQQTGFKEVPFWMRISMLILALLCIVMGFLLIPQLKTVLLGPCREVLIRGTEYGNLIKNFYPSLCLK